MKLAIQLIAGAAVFMATEYILAEAVFGVARTVLLAQPQASHQTAPTGRRHP